MSDSNFSNTNRDMDFAGINVLNWPISSDPNILDPGQVTDWTWYNKGTASATRYDNTKTIDLVIPPSGGVGVYRNRGLYKAIPNPSNQWSFIAKCIPVPNLYDVGGDTATCKIGLGIRSISNDFLFFAVNPWDRTLSVFVCPTSTAPWILIYATVDNLIPNYAYYKINSDGVQNNFYVSSDGNEWSLITSVILGTIDDEISYGFFGVTGNGCNTANSLCIYSSRFLDGVL